jgi:two-component system, response regulator PdtaR
MTEHRHAVLVVEDEPIIRLSIAYELQDAGFEAFEASNAIEAIEILADHLEIRLMFTDIDMLPGISGLRLAGIVRCRWPSVKIIITSGLHQIPPDAMPATSRFMPKPYVPSEVIAAISEMTTV